ncbi:MAG: 4Fe-4S dicluster domain-containing protein, partial [Bacteriovoracaceae bacterium]|nr:4Fe-4S dicluster domain-containing protein [Bacteriovoracaceae bacterium]
STYWQDIHQKILDPKINKAEFTEGEFDSFSVQKSRRDFLKIMGFSFTMLPMASCTKGIVRKAVPYLEKTDTVIPGVAQWYASTFDSVPVLLKTREGRPIKVEGNDSSLYTLGGAGVQTQASVLSLYDSYRLKNPLKDSLPIVWDNAILEIRSLLDKAQKEGQEAYLVTEALRSPTQFSLIEELQKKYTNLKHIVYQNNISGTVHRSLGDNYLVEHDLSEVKYLVSIAADFLVTGEASVHLSKQYAKRKEESLHGHTFKHVQIESRLSLTGSNADDRIILNPDEVLAFITSLYFKVIGASEIEKSNRAISAALNSVYNQLMKNKGQSLLMVESGDVRVERMVHQINLELGNFGKSLKANKYPFVKNAEGEKFEELIQNLSKSRGKVDTIIMVNVNPYYDYPNQNVLKEAFERVPHKIVITSAENETSKVSEYVLPLSHQFEMWGDTLISLSEVSVTQPIINPLFNSKSYAEIYLALLGRVETSDQYMKDVWKKYFSSEVGLFKSFDMFWIESVQRGVFKIGANHDTSLNSKKLAQDSDAKSVLGSVDLSTDQIFVVLYEKSMGTGQYASNPWLQELPDPITKVTWDNYAQISSQLAKKYDLVTGDMIELKVGEAVVVLPVLVQAGLNISTIAVAVGYGRTVAGKAALNVGKNVFPFASLGTNGLSWSRANVSLSKTGRKYQLALTQTHHSIEGRDLIRETTLDKFVKNPKAGNEKKTHLMTMWSEEKKTGHQWAMAIDLNKCNGCSACVVSCNAENNVPVVGREEVLQRREMHWMRIDRYYKGEEANPSVAFQPMTCHHCDNAPCETVCPVLATVHSSDGMNQQVYNRCVGTRYCANNCPYKVRRFNWFDYPHADPNENMVLNPDVTVRSRGVMEKCSLCIQRVQEAKLQAKKEGREVRDGEIKLACQQSCSSDAIIFGDLNDPDSKISKMVKDSRNFTVLEELNVKPRLSYLTKVKNKD